MEQETGEEAVAHIGVREAVKASEPRRDEALTHRRLRRQAEAEVDRDREAGKEVGEPHASRHGAILHRAAVFTRSSLANVNARSTPILAHLDLDAFFAAVEELENPELREKPLVVGGDPHSRGVVSTANYAARKFGIHSAMSAAEALRRCPTAVFLRPRHALYRQYSRVVWDTIGEIVPRVERTGIDEGYLDLGTVARDFTRHAPSRRRSRPPCARRRA